MLDHGERGIVALEPRVLLNASPAARLAAHDVAHHGNPSARNDSHHAEASHTSKRLTPTPRRSTKQYANFTMAFNNVVENYVQSINEQSTGKVSVSTTVQGDYSTPPLPSTILVADAAVFGPEGDYSSAVTATAVLGSATLGTVYITGSSGNYLIITPASGYGDNAAERDHPGRQRSHLGPNECHVDFPSYITNSTIQLAIGLVQYFNNLPIKLPPENAPPAHARSTRGDSVYVYQNIASSLGDQPSATATCHPLPTTPGSDLPDLPVRGR